MYSSGSTDWLKHLTTMTCSHRAGCITPNSAGHGAADIAAEAWRLLLTEKAKLAPVPQYRYDLIDVARQV